MVPRVYVSVDVGVFCGATRRPRRRWLAGRTAGYGGTAAGHGGVCRNRANVLVFVSFLVVQVFLLHNILLASVSKLRRLTERVRHTKSRRMAGFKGGGAGSCDRWRFVMPNKQEGNEQ